MKKYKADFIKLSIAYRALKFGEFELKSGRISPYFFNVGSLCTGRALSYLATAYASAIKARTEVSFDTLFGPAYKGIPLSAITATVLYDKFDVNVYCAYNRKQGKDHGEGGQIVGEVCSEVLIVDDVLTAGTTVREAISVVSAHARHARVKGVLIALDRQEIGLNNNKSAVQEIQEKCRIPVLSVVTFSDIVEFCEDSSGFERNAEAMKDYRDKYGVE